MTFLTLNISQAQTSPEIIQYMYSELRADEKRDYEFVVKSCGLDLDSFATLVESTKDDTVDYFHFFFGMQDSVLPEQENLITRKGIGRHVHRLLNSTGYYVGLMSCYPNSQRDRDVYTGNLLMFDAYGKVTALSMIGLSGAALYRSIAFVGRKAVVSPTVAALRKLNASEAVIAKTPQYMGRAGVWAFNGLSAALLASHIYRIKQERKIIKTVYSENDLSSIRRNFETNLGLYKEAKSLYAQAKTPEERESVKKLIDEQRDTVSFYLDQMLEAQDLPPQEKEVFVAIKQVMETES